MPNIVNDDFSGFSRMYPTMFRSPGNKVSSLTRNKASLSVLVSDVCHCQNYQPYQGASPLPTTLLRALTAAARTLLSLSRAQQHPPWNPDHTDSSHTMQPPAPASLQRGGGEKAGRQTWVPIPTWSTDHL